MLKLPRTGVIDVTSYRARHLIGVEDTATSSKLLAVAKVQCWQQINDVWCAQRAQGEMLQYQSFWFVFEPQRLSLSNSK